MSKQGAFKTPDGRHFATRKEWKKHYRSLLRFKDETDKHDLCRRAPIVDGNSFDLYNLKRCTAMLLDHCEEVKIDCLENCKIFIGPCCSSVFVRDCKNCEFTIACKQLRTRSCTDCKVHLYAMTDPIIESSTGMIISRYNGAFPKQDEHFKAANLKPLENRWRKIYDFTPSTTDKPNWTLSDEYTEWAVGGGDNEKDAKPINPVPKTSGDHIKDDDEESNDSGGMKTFSFKTTQAEAQKILDEAKKKKKTAPAPATTTMAATSAPPVPTPTMATTTTATTSSPPVPTPTTATATSASSAPGPPIVTAPPSLCCATSGANPLDPMRTEPSVNATARPGAQ